MTGFLLDTHTLLWWWTDPDRLSPAAREMIASATDTIFVSVASVWEIAIKTRSGKLTVVEDFERDYDPLMRANAFSSLPIRADHALRAGFLPGAHRDPFDRVLSAQALIENMTVVTRDPEIARFGRKVLW